VQRRSLPISGARGPLLARLRRLDTAILIGETGSGKTTQLPQYLYEVGIGHPGVIAVTQPRRVAAVTLAARVAEEKRTELGKLVGNGTAQSSRRVWTLLSGMLRLGLLGCLCRARDIIFVRLHESSIARFQTLAFQEKLRATLTHPVLSLKVIVMSATMDVDLFSQYFNGAPVIYLEGRQHPIEIFYTKEQQSDYLQAALVSIFQIHQEAPACQDILVFLTGQEEIEAMTKTCRDVAQHLPEGCPRMTVLPLYASLPHSQQLRAFKPTPEGCRKVILSTNIAETSITIAGIKFVVDTGMVKAKKYSPETGLEVLAVQQVSKAQAWQRTGRAGRQDSGICYRLYTEEDFEKFDEMTTPEIQRCNLASVVLQLLALKIPNVLTFDFMSKPSPDAIQAAIDQLDLLGAVTQKEGQVVLTALGKKMAAFPLDPKFSKAILLSPKFHCAEEILTIVSLLSVDSVLHNPPAQRDEVQAVRKKFISSEGDHLTLLNVYRAYKNVNGHQ
ncbi:DHX33 helicase, partial [Leiothrix lutea]|nr:DHX33 helicase [Leiothrix lutea]